MLETMSENAPENNEAIGEASIQENEATSMDVVPGDSIVQEVEPAEKKPGKLDYSYTQNRELSWLQFDKRVLEEALDPSVPLLERMKFICIFCTNLDEFFMVRVGSLMDLSIIAPEIRENKTNMTPREQLEEIFKAVKPLVKERDKIYTKVAEELKDYGFKELDLDEISKKDRKFARDYYREFIKPVLSPQVVDERHPFPHLRNKDLYVVTVLTDKDGSQHLGIIPVPDNVSPIIADPDNPLHFVRAEKLIEHHVKKIFDIYETSDPCIISVTRNADISFDEEKFADDEGDYRLHVSRLLKKRNRLQPVRLEIEGKPDKTLLAGLLKRLKIAKNQVYVYDAPINLGWVFGLDRRVDANDKSKLCYAPFVPRASKEFDINRSILKQVEERDRLLFYPYDSIDPFLRMLQEAATDPDVLSIKITVYRLASESRVAQHLAEAAENGKEVTVLMELRARFDEANNIDWSGRLEEAGCNIIYGLENYKCHSKVCLITKRSPGGVKYITQIGTGNYNEKTARLYTDLSLFTSDTGIGMDAVAFFQNMLIGNLNGDYQKLLVAPVAIKSTILRLIDREIAKGTAGRITLKANSVTERDIIDRLALASQAGVQIRMNIRGICCMLPGIEGKTENLHVRSVVGQFLEHSRIFVFGEGDDMLMYVGSADLMTRNLCHRVEVAVPITTKRARDSIMVFLDKIFEDNTKARALEPTGEYKKIAESRDKDMCDCSKSFNVQEWCIENPLQGVKRSKVVVSNLLDQDIELDLEFETRDPAEVISDEEVESRVDALFEDEATAFGQAEAVAEEIVAEAAEAAEETVAVESEEVAAEEVAAEEDAVEEAAKSDAAEEAEAVEEAEAEAEGPEEQVEAAVEEPEPELEAVEEPAVEEPVAEETVDEIVVAQYDAAGEALEPEPEVEVVVEDADVAQDDMVRRLSEAINADSSIDETEQKVADDMMSTGEFMPVNPFGAVIEAPEIDETEPRSDEAFKVTVESAQTPASEEPASPVIAQDFDLSFLFGKAKKADDIIVEEQAALSEPIDEVIEEVEEVEVATPKTVHSEKAAPDYAPKHMRDAEDAPVDTTPTEERLAKERDFMRDFPHTTRKADEGQDDAPASAAEDETPEQAEEQQPEKKGFFKGLFS